MEPLTNRPFKTGALPSSRHALAGAVPHRKTVQQPASWIRVPQRLSMWLNDVDGDCVTAEEAFAKACSGILISDNTVKTWATAHDVLNGAYLDQVLDWMAQAGFHQDGNVYNDGGKVGVDYSTADILTNAIYLGPVKIGVASTQLDSVPGIGQRNGWVATGFRRDSNLDHCTSLCGYGSIAQLCAWLGGTVPHGVDGTQPGYAFFTWSTIGVIDVPSMLAITGEAWLRTPTTITQGSGTPTPDPVVTPTPPPPPPPPPVGTGNAITYDKGTQPGTIGTYTVSK